MIKNKKYMTLAAALMLTLTSACAVSFAQDNTTTAAHTGTAGAPMGTPPELPPGMTPGMPPQGGPGGNQGKQLADFTAAKMVTGTTTTVSGQTLSASSADQNTILAKNSAAVTIQNSHFSKTGDTTSGDGSNFSGQNAVVLAADSDIKINDSTITSAAEGANAIFATGDKSHIDVKHVTIHTTGNSSRGLDATCDGTITADDVSITTQGAHCAALATDRGEGTVIVRNAKLSTHGEGSPCVYSTGAITLQDSTGTASGSEIAVVEGKNSISLDNVNLTGYVKHGVMLYQSFSGDADTGIASFSAANSTLKTVSNGPMFYITNTKAKAHLENTNLQYNSNTLVNVTSDHWGTSGANGGDFTLTTARQTLHGNVLANSLSTVDLQLSDKTTWQGSFNADNQAKSAALSLDASSGWNVTGTSYVTTLTDSDTTLRNIQSNGHTIYYQSKNKANQWLHGKTITLSGNGKLQPFRS
jgi:hypothetical protein